VAGLAPKILKQAESLPEGTILSAKVLLHLGSRAAVDQALSRLARSGTLMRVRRGYYVRPLPTRFGPRAPAPEKVVEALAHNTGETVVPSGAASANALGLTTQVPARTVFLTSGPSRRLHLGRQSIELKHAPAWQLKGAGRPAGHALRALAWLGPEHAREGAAKLKRSLPEAERHELLAARSGLPTWLAEMVSKTFAKEARAKPGRTRV
jgi:hypothetical protein